MTSEDLILCVETTTHKKQWSCRKNCRKKCRNKCRKKL